MVQQGSSSIRVIKIFQGIPLLILAPLFVDSILGIYDKFFTYPQSNFYSYAPKILDANFYWNASNLVVWAVFPFFIVLLLRQIRGRSLDFMEALLAFVATFTINLTVPANSSYILMRYFYNYGFIDGIEWYLAPISLSLLLLNIGILLEII